MSEETMIPSAKELREQSVRTGIDSLIALCTPEQVAFLHKIHDSSPWKGLHNCPADKLDDTYELLRRTVVGNQKERR